MSQPVVIKPLIPDHDLLRCIGSGSFGDVWLARDGAGLFRAVKVVYRHTFSNDRPFEREFNGIQKFEPISRSDKSQVNILQIGRNKDFFYCVMELADDQTRGQQFDPGTYAPKSLWTETQQRGRLPFNECLDIALALAGALKHLHANGLVHRDVKPANVIFVGGVPKLVDIGLVTDASATLSFGGTDGFYPPEGAGTPQADVYSLGKVLYEISTGKDRNDFPEIPALPEGCADREQLIEFGEVVKKACAPNLSERYASAEALRAELLLLKAGKSVRETHRAEQKRKMAKRIGLAAAIFGAVAFGIYLFAKH